MCEYCDGTKKLREDKGDYGWSIEIYPNKQLVAGHEEADGSCGSFWLDIKYCPMCGRRLEASK